MKKGTKIAIIIAIIILIILVIIGGTYIAKNKIKRNTDNLNKQESKLNIQTVEDMKILINKAQEGVELYPSIETNIVDINDTGILKMFTGLDSNEKIDQVVVAEPMIGSQAYSMVLVKVKDSANTDEIAKQMHEKINPRKWICVTAEKVYTTSSDDIVCLVMSDEQLAKPVYENFKKIAGNVGEEYEKDGESTEIDENMPGRMSL